MRTLDRQSAFGPTAAGCKAPHRFEVDTQLSAAHRDLMVRLLACPLIVGVALAMPAVASAELYKWVDESGTITYGDTPPPRAKSVHVLGKDSGSLSVVPGLAPEQLERMRDKAQELRMRRLEVELEELRLRGQMLAQAQRHLAYGEPHQAVVYGGGYWAGGYPVGPGWRDGKWDKRFWPRPAHRSRPDLDLLPYQRALQRSSPQAVGPPGGGTR